MNFHADWAKAASQFQENLGEGWRKALESFQSMASGTGAQSGPAAPTLNFVPAKLMELQQAYLREASELWNKGLGAAPGATRLSRRGN